MQRYFAKEKNNSLLTLQDSDIRHIKLVMRMQDNDEIEVVFDNILYLCCISNVKENIKIKIKSEIKKTDDNNFCINLIIPVLKEQKFDLILQKATELGVNNIIPIETERTIVKIKEKDKLDRWYKILKEASEQSKRIDIPNISSPIKLKELKHMNGLSLVCSTISKNNIKNVFKNIKNCDTINIVVGPEGGLSLEEEKYLNTLDFISVSLGSRILRVETAPIVVLSILNYINME